LKEQGLTKAQRIRNPAHRVTKRLYSINEASIYLGRSVWAVREMLWAGKLPCIKDGRRILLDIKDMESWVEKNKIRFEF
jgi:excisionase family DNA binding protein